jgi:hypothetical protein
MTGGLRLIVKPAEQQSRTARFAADNSCFLPRSPNRRIFKDRNELECIFKQLIVSQMITKNERTKEKPTGICVSAFEIANNEFAQRFRQSDRKKK